MDHRYRGIFGYLIFVNDKMKESGCTLEEAGAEWRAMFELNQPDNVIHIDFRSSRAEFHA